MRRHIASCIRQIDKQAREQPSQCVPTSLEFKFLFLLLCCFSLIFFVAHHCVYKYSSSRVLRSGMTKADAAKLSCSMGHPLEPTNSSLKKGGSATSGRRLALLPILGMEGCSRRSSANKGKGRVDKSCQEKDWSAHIRSFALKKKSLRRDTQAGRHPKKHRETCKQHRESLD